jgi:7-cyano-7-deazaguanine synthase
MMKPAVVLLSGGLDSATCLAIARSQGFDCYCLSFDYGQRHNAELKAAERVVQALGAEHRVLNLGLAQFGGSALTDTSIAVPTAGVQPGIPVTYVPARNTIMLSLALAWAEVLGSMDIFVGVNAVDYSGYPDCRPDYIAAFEKWRTWRPVRGRRAQAVHPRAADRPVEGDIIRTGTALGVDYGLTVSCYQADDQGRPAGLAIRVDCVPRALPRPASPTPPSIEFEHGKRRFIRHRSLAGLRGCLRLRRHRPEDPFLHHGRGVRHRQHGRLEPHAHVAAGHRRRHPRRRALHASGQIDLGKSIYRTPTFTWLSYLLGGACFGIGMVLASGCGSKTLIRIGGGNLKSLVVFVTLGWSPT